MRTTEEQVQGLDAVARQANLLHRVNLGISISGGDVPFLTGSGHGEGVQIVYAHGDYDVWIVDPGRFGGLSMAESDVTVEEAARILADAYMYDKATSVLRRLGVGPDLAQQMLSDDTLSADLYAALDEGSDKALQKVLRARDN